MKNSVTRKCILSNKIKPVSELIRIVKTKKGDIIINSDANGRGAYVSKKISNPEIMLKNKILNRIFKFDVPKEKYYELIKLIKGE